MIVAGGTVVGIVLIAIADDLRPGFEAWIKQDVGARSRIVFGALTLLTAGPALAAAAYCWRLGRRIVRTGRFPPPGYRVVRDTPVVIGDAAARWGRLVQTLAAVIGTAGVFLAFFLWRLFFFLSRGPA
jgi:hypothetical protein